MTGNSIVHVVDDDSDVRQSLETLLGSVGFTVRTYQSADAFLATFRDEAPSCLITDVRMPGLSGLQLQKEMEARSIDLPVIVISGHGDIDVAVKAMRQGALHFLSKPFKMQEMLEEVNRAIARHREIWQARQKRVGFTECLQSLTPREREIAALLVDGKSSKSIALALAISDRTVDAHRGRILAKFGARTALELIRMFRDAGAFRNPTWVTSPQMI